MRAVQARTMNPVLVSIVTHNDDRFLEGCRKSVRCQRVPVRVKVFDNASEDGTL